MTKRKTFAIAIISLMAALSFNLIGTTQPPTQPSVQLLTAPNPAQLLPFEAEATTPQSPARLTLKALDATGQPLENAKIHLTIFTPPKNTWFPTDFPAVEATKLLDIETIAPNGKLQVHQMFPIRGKYQLLVNVAPISKNQFTPFQQKLVLFVPENPIKWINLAILAMILLLVGSGGGWIIAGKQEFMLGIIAPKRVRLLLSGVVVVAIAALIFVNINVVTAESHSHAPDNYSENLLSTVRSEIIDSTGIKLQISGDNEATVGQLANFQIQAIDTKTNQPTSDLTFKIKTIQQEDKWVSFAYKGTTDANGKFAWQQQFFDGNPHKVEVEFASKDNKATEFVPLLLTKPISVEDIAPPLSVRLVYLAYLTVIIAIGLILGFALRRLPIEKFIHLHFH